VVNSIYYERTMPDIVNINRVSVFQGGSVSGLFGLQAGLLQRAGSGIFLPN
jgi:hypothetical protein